MNCPHNHIMFVCLRERSRSLAKSYRMLETLLVLGSTAPLTELRRRPSSTQHVAQKTFYGDIAQRNLVLYTDRPCNSLVSVVAHAGGSPAPILDCSDCYMSHQKFCSGHSHCNSVELMPDRIFRLLEKR